VSPDHARAAIVTGAASGIGEAIAGRLARDGWSVLLFDEASGVGETATRLGTAHGVDYETLVSRVGSIVVEQEIEDAVAHAVERFGGLELVVANAAVGGVEVDLIDLDPAGFDRTVAVNLRGAYLTCRAGGRVLRAARRGAIVTIGSIFGWEPLPRAAGYSATKAGVHALTQGLALELAPYNVRVNSVAPGYIATDGLWTAMRGRAAHAGISLDDEVARVHSSVPLGRLGAPEEIGSAVAFLASDDAAYITGHTLGVTGGVVRQ
jgi:3-oxoacyl-[acyl-carrier protein] reductase